MPGPGVPSSRMTLVRWKMQRENPAAVKPTVRGRLPGRNLLIVAPDASHMHHKLAAVWFTWHDAPVAH